MSTVKPNPSSALPKKQQVEQMFDNIAPRYDFLNHFLSLGIDLWWRKIAINGLKKYQPKQIIDVATGTGDFAFESLKRLNPDFVTGVDISEGMLQLARVKAKDRKTERISFSKGDSENLNFEDNSFDAATVAFGVRNFENLEKGLEEIKRVLKPGGRLVVLEFSKPSVFPVKQLYHFYFRYILPTTGKIISKDSSAYTYLPESVNAFPEGQQFTNILEKLGYQECKSRALTFGICSLYTACK